MDTQTHPTQRVRLRVGAQGFVADLDVPAPAVDLTGLVLVEFAVRAAWHNLPSRLAFPDGDPDCAEAMHYVELRNHAGQTAYVEDTYLRGHEWLADLVIRADVLPPSAAWLRDDDIVRVRFAHTDHTLLMTAREARAAGLQFADDSRIPNAVTP